MSEPGRHGRSARRVLQVERDALSAAADRIDINFESAIEALLHVQGRVIVTGMGKSGHVARKIAATLASTGTPSFYMHPAEAVHGDLGMVRDDDAVLALSYSGETGEVIRLLPFFAESGNLIVSMTGNAGSTLAKASSHHVDVSVAEEACALQLAPTSSTTLTLAMGDAVAVALMESRGFRPENFARFHPGGSLGRRLLSTVDREMITDDIPSVGAEAPFSSVLGELTRRRLGLVIVRDGKRLGIITDGDIRRAVEQDESRVFERTADSLMSSNPVSVPLGTRVEDAILLADRRGVAAILVMNSQSGHLAGVFLK